MSEFTFDRRGTTVIVLRVPTIVWDRWEYRHQHFGKAIHALRESCIEIMAARSSSTWEDAPDPFFTEGKR